jgi:site-specific recombinase XerD
MKAFKTVRKDLYNFNASYHKLDIQGYTLDVHNKLLDYWLNVLDINPNTMATRIKKLKVFFRYCTEDRNINLHPDWKRIKAPNVSPDKIFLTWEELEMMRKAKLKTSLAHVRDAFLFSCYTSLRHSDLFKFNHSHIVDKGSYKVISFVAKKTAGSKVNRLEIALNNFALELIEKYKDRQLKALPVITNQKMNNYLKEAGKIAGINSMVERVFYKNGVPDIEIVPKYECITTHTARHTFATQSLMMGMDVAVLQKILGHSDIQTTMIYAKIVDEYKHKVMLDVWNGSKAKQQVN